MIYFDIFCEQKIKPKAAWIEDLMSGGWCGGVCIQYTVYGMAYPVNCFPSCQPQEVFTVYVVYLTNISYNKTLQILLRERETKIRMIVSGKNNRMCVKRVRKG